MTKTVRLMQPLVMSKMARSLLRLLTGCQRLASSPSVSPHFCRSSPGLPFGSSFVRSMVALPFSFSLKPRDFSLPNSSWSTEMMRLYDFYNSQCELENESGEKQRGPWRRVPSYNRTLKYATGGAYLSKLIQSKNRLFTRSIKTTGAAFEYVMFINKEEQRCVCIFQAGHLLEGPPGHVHGGAIATMIDSVTGAHATFLSGPVMTANLNINYRSPIPLGSTVILESSLDNKEGRKTFISCKVTSTDGSKLHTEATGASLQGQHSRGVIGTFDHTVLGLRLEGRIWVWAYNVHCRKTTLSIGVNVSECLLCYRLSTLTQSGCDSLQLSPNLSEE